MNAKQQCNNIGCISVRIYSLLSIAIPCELLDLRINKLNCQTYFLSTYKLFISCVQIIYQTNCIIDLTKHKKIQLKRNNTCTHVAKNVNICVYIKQNRVSKKK